MKLAHQEGVQDLTLTFQLLPEAQLLSVCNL